MVRTRSRSRRQRKEPQETQQSSDIIDQDYLYVLRCTASSSPLRSPFRNIKKSTSSLPSCLKAATRVLKTNRDVRTLGSQHCTSSLVVKSDQAYDHPAKPVAQGPQEAQQVAPSSRDNYVFPQVEDIVPGKGTTYYVGKTSHCLSTSFNLTEFAKGQLDETDDDEEEVESASDPAFACVDGYKVKRENASLLRAIFDKYGDITWESDGQPLTIVSFFLERICAIYEKLKGTNFSEVTRKDINEMLDEVRFLESQKIDLIWLRVRLEYISNTKMSSQNYLTAKEEGLKCSAVIKSLEDELEARKREVSLIKEKLAAEKDKADLNKKMARDIKAQVDDLRKQSLVHGLL